MSELELVAAAISSIINCPVKTYDEFLADGLDVLPNQILDLDIVHKYSFVRQGDDELVEKPSFRQSDEKVEKIEKTEKVEKVERVQTVIHRRSRQCGEIEILSSQRIQIFVRTSFGRSHSIFVFPNSTVLELKQAIQAKLYINRPIRLEFSSKPLNDHKTLESYNIKRGDTIHILFRILGGSGCYVIRDDFIDPRFNFDFTNLRDDGTTYMRGNESYKRPYGWKRIALNVKKYGTNSEWLGSVGNSSNEWPVSYHGTKKNFANSIAEEGYLLSKGKRFAYGKGIYSSPEIRIAEGYASTFCYEGFNYKVVFQNRVNPENLQKADTPHGPYWITPDEKNIRPYGLCLKKLNKCDNNCAICTV